MKFVYKIFLVLMIIGLGLSAQSSTADFIGKKQSQLTRVDNCDQPNNCWEKCPYDFSSCLDKCGEVDGCWSKCPYDFSSCHDRCGRTKGCWDKCPYDFNTCNDKCG